MEVFRISEETYSKKLTASGIASRWNEDKQYVIYTGSSRALSTLEKVVHFNSIEPSASYKVMIISIADRAKIISEIFIDDLPSNWRSHISYPLLRQISSKWYTSKQSLVLKVPSAVIV